MYNRPIFNPIYSDVRVHHEVTTFTSFITDIAGDEGLEVTLDNQSLLPQFKKSLQELCQRTLSEICRTNNVAEFCCQRCFTIFPPGRHRDLFLKHPCNDDPTSERCATSGLIPITNRRFKDYFESLLKRLDPQQQEIALHVHAKRKHIFLFGPGGKGKSFLMNVLKLYFIQEYSYDQVC